MKNNLSLNTIYKTDFYSFAKKAFYEIDNSQKFISNWHLALIADRLMECYFRNIKRLIINLPPRSLKSHFASIALPCWLLGHNPDARIISVSYSNELSSKFCSSSMKLMNTDFYKQVFKTRLSKNKQSESEFQTTGNGYYFATSTQGTLTGIGGDYIIVDDPIKAADANSSTLRKKLNNWYDNTLSSRLNNKKEGVIIVIMQRLHIDDLTGHLLKQDGWEVLSLPAIAEKDEEYVLGDGRVVGRKSGEALNPALEPIEELDNQKKIMSEYHFSAQYQQRPIPQKGNLINFEDFETYDILPRSDGRDRTVQSWDIALSSGVNNDYSACATGVFQGNKLYLIDMYRAKLDYCDLIEKIKDMKDRYRASQVVIEDTSVSKHLIAQLKRDNFNLIPKPPKGSKEHRAILSTPFMREGRVLIPSKAPWLEEFRNEILSFPQGRNDDQVDAFTQLVDELNNIDKQCSQLALIEALVKYKKEKSLGFYG